MTDVFARKASLLHDIHRRHTMRSPKSLLASATALGTILALTLSTAQAAAAASATYGPTLPRASTDRADDDARPQVHLIYVLPSDGQDRALDTNGTITNTVTSFNTWLAAKTGNRPLRLDTYQGSLDISFLRLDRTDSEMASHGAYVRDQIEVATKAAGFDAPNKIYAVYYDGTSNWACGGAAWPPALVGNVAAMYLHGLPNASTPCDTQRFASAGASPTYMEFAMLHEIVHTMGFVATCAPNSWRGGHTSDDANDLMWAGDGAWAPSGWANVVLDRGNDDYYGHENAGCADLDDSDYLVQASPSCGLPGVPTYGFYTPSALSTNATPTVPTMVRWKAASGTACRYDLERQESAGWKTVYSGSALGFKSMASLGGFPAHRVRSRDSAGKTSVWAVAVASTLDGYPETSASYTGTFTRQNNAAYWGGAMTSTKAVGASSSMAFTGQSIALVGTKCAACGSMKIYIDGVYKATVSEYAGTSKHRQVVGQWAVTRGDHRITVVNVGTSGRPTMTIDGFTVLR
jgi:hypothetical protein